MCFKRLFSSRYPAVDVWQPSFSGCRFLSLEQFATPRHVCTVTACFLSSSEDFSLQTQFSVTILSCPRSDTCHYGHINRSYLPELAGLRFLPSLFLAKYHWGKMVWDFITSQILFLLSNVLHQNTEETKHSANEWSGRVLFSSTAGLLMDVIRHCCLYANSQMQLLAADTRLASLVMQRCDRVIVEHARGTPRGEDLRRDLDRGYSIPARRGPYYGGGGGGGGGGRNRFVFLSLCSSVLSLLVIIFTVCVSTGSIAITCIRLVSTLIFRTE